MRALADLLARVASALERARAAPRAPTALLAEFPDLRTALAAASDAASTTIPTHALAALRAIATDDAAVAETELAAMETAVDSVLRAAAALKNAVADATRRPRPRNSPPQKQCVTVTAEASMLTPPENAGKAPEFESCQNFTRTPIPGKKVAANCSMCGRANKETLTSPNVDGVPIANQMKDVCGHCIGAVWRHVATGYYLRFCKGCKNFRHVHEYALGDGDRESLDPFTTGKCAACRAANRAVYHNKKPRLKK